MEVLNAIIAASFIMASGLFAVLMGYFISFRNNIKNELAKQEETVIKDQSKAMVEPIGNLIKNSPDIQPDQIVQRLSELFENMFESMTDINKRQGLIREPYIWLDDLKRGICLAILLFLAAGTLGLSYYDTYVPLIFVAGVASVVYGVYKFYQITERIAR